MKFETLLKFWKSNKAIADAFGVTHQAVTRWSKLPILPKGIAFEAHWRSHYKLTVNVKLYE